MDDASRIYRDYLGWIFNEIKNDTVVQNLSHNDPLAYLRSLWNDPQIYVYRQHLCKAPLDSILIRIYYKILA